MNVLFVCFENTCRSPIAEALLKRKYEENNIVSEVDSAGFESFNINEPPDARAQIAAETHGIKLEGRARLFVKGDFKKFDKIYVMDMQSYHDTIDLAASQQEAAKVEYLSKLIRPDKFDSIPDPLMHGNKKCHEIIQFIDEATDVILNMVLKQD